MARGIHRLFPDPGIKVVRLRNPSSHGVISTNEDDRIRPRGIHFLRDGTRIVVSYLNHGLTLSAVFFHACKVLLICAGSCFDTTSGDMLWNWKPREGYPFMYVRAHASKIQ